MTTSMRYWLVLASALIAACFCLPAHSGSSRPSWTALGHTSFRHHDHASLASGTAMVQDQHGFIWLGTQTGLVRWDGLRTRVYKATPEKAGSLPDSMIQSLHVDRSNRLWIGTSSGGLARYDAELDSFVSIPVGAGGTNDASISAIISDGADGLWLGSGAGLEHISRDGVVRSAASGDPCIPAKALGESGVDALLRDRSGGLWIGTRSGLYYRAGNSASIGKVAVAESGKAALAISALYQDSRGRIWIGTRASGAFVLDSVGGVARPVVESDRDGTLPRERTFSLLEISDGVMWIGTEGGGIVEVDTITGHTRRIKRRADVPDSLIDDDATAMLRERGGQVFVATIDAISQHDPRPQGVTTLRYTGQASKLSIPSLLVRPNGQVWLGVLEGTIEIIDPQRGNIGRIAADGKPGQLPRGRALTMTNGPDGAVYIGTQQGLFRSDLDGRQVRRLSVPGRSANAPVLAMAWHGNTLWLGGNDGVWVLSMNGAPKLLRHESEKLGDRRVSAILPVDDESAWIGTHAGLARMRITRPEVEVVPTDPADSTRQPRGYVASLMLDRQGRLWTASFPAGVTVLEKTDAKGRRWFKRLRKADGLPDDGVNAFVPDRHNRIWLSTDNGIASIDPSTYKVTSLGSADGVQVAAYWTGAGARGADGEILFGGLKGLTVIQPERLQRAAMPAAVAVTQVMLGNREISATPFNRTMPATLTLTADERGRGFALEYTVLDFAPPERNRLTYRLQGLDQDWTGADSTIRRVVYNNLPPGNYVLQLRTRSAVGDGDGALDVPVRVMPAWYQRIGVKVLGAVGAACLVAGLVQLRTSILRRRQRELEAMVEVRTAELRATQGQLETMAYDDVLTGLPNRRRFNDELRRLATDFDNAARAFALVLIDLDHFKSINDTLGHDAGDALLVAAAGRLGHAVRDSDRVFRLGGDEFAMLLAGCDEHTVEQICQRVVDTMAEPIYFGAERMQVSASVGAATSTPGRATVDRLYKAADEALYASKDAGRNGWHLAA